MGQKVKGIFWVGGLVALLLVVLPWIYQNDIAMLNPKGWVAVKERNLMLVALLLMLIVVIPVFILTVVISYKYRDTNKEATYDPEWNHNVWAEAIWWGFPFAIVVVLSILTFKSSHELDPFKPLTHPVPPLTIQVVALQWKWLFIYPAQKIATVNFFQIPEQTPIHFELTSDAPMNSFWIPQLGGQIYAMPGMKTQLHLIANEVGSFRGSSANLSGTGFSEMSFTVKSSSPEEFENWVEVVKKTPHLLDEAAYEKLAQPSEQHLMDAYQFSNPSLFEWIVMQSMKAPHVR